VECESELSGLNVLQVLIIAKLFEPFSYGLLAMLLNAFMEEVLKASDCDANVSRAVSLQEVQSKVILRETLASALVQHLKLIIRKFLTNLEIELSEDILND